MIIYDNDVDAYDNENDMVILTTIMVMKVIMIMTMIM